MVPTLEEFGLTPSVYSNYHSQRNRLQEEKNQLEKQIRAITDNSFIGLFYGLFVYSLIGILIYLGMVLSSYIGGWAWLLALTIPWGFSLLEDRLPNSIVENIVSFGRYGKAEERLKIVSNLLNELEVSIKIEVSSFETAFYSHFQGSLESFFNTRLYRKKSGNQEFEESIQEFSSILDDLVTANDVLLTKQFYLTEYQQYLRSRIINHSFRQNRHSSKEFQPVASFIEEASKLSSEPKTLPPEEIYRVPRKIDWESVNRGKMLIGSKGEEIVLAIEKHYLLSINRQDLSESVQHISKDQGDGSGYDILSFSANGKEKYIEVKTTTKSFEWPYYISRNELSFLKEHPENSFVYRVLLSEDSPDGHELKAQTAEDILEESEITPINYIVRTR